MLNKTIDTDTSILHDKYVESIINNKIIIRWKSSCFSLVYKKYHYKMKILFFALCWVFLIHCTLGIGIGQKFIILWGITHRAAVSDKTNCVTTFKIFLGRASKIKHLLFMDMSVNGGEDTIFFHDTPPP